MKSCFCDSMGESKEKWNKWDREGQALYGLTYMWNLNKLIKTKAGYR